MPIKTCADLLVIQSDLYSFEHGQPVPNERRMFHNAPVIKLGDRFKKVPVQRTFYLVPPF